MNKYIFFLVTILVLKSSNGAPLLTDQSKKRWVYSYALHKFTAGSQGDRLKNIQDKDTSIEYNGLRSEDHIPGEGNNTLTEATNTEATLNYGDRLKGANNYGFKVASKSIMKEHTNAFRFHISFKLMENYGSGNIYLLKTPPNGYLGNIWIAETTHKLHASYYNADGTGLNFLTTEFVIEFDKWMELVFTLNSNIGGTDNSANIAAELAFRYVDETSTINKFNEIGNKDMHFHGIYEQLEDLEIGRNFNGVIHSFYFAVGTYGWTLNTTVDQIATWIPYDTFDSVDVNYFRHACTTNTNCPNILLCVGQIRDWARCILEKKNFKRCTGDFNDLTGCTGCDTNSKLSTSDPLKKECLCNATIVADHGGIPDVCDCSSTKVFSGGKCIYKNCGRTCATCLDQTTCQTCISAIGVRTSAPCGCSDGYFDTGTDCIKCGWSCKTCASSTTCATCNVEAEGVEAKAPCRCKDGYFHTGTSCQKCPTGCQRCTNATTCEFCWNLKGILKELPCGCDTSHGYFETTTGICTSCALGTYPDHATHSCAPCSNISILCTKCYDQKTCTQCINNARLKEHDCFCDDGYMFDQLTTKCVPVVFTEKEEDDDKDFDLETEALVAILVVAVLLVIIAVILCCLCYFLIYKGKTKTKKKETKSRHPVKEFLGVQSEE